MLPSTRVPLPSRRPRPNNAFIVKLLVIFVAAVGATFFGVMNVAPYVFGGRRWLRPHQPVAAAGTDFEEPLAVGLKTKTRGLLDLHVSDGTKYLMVQCHRGQFSNRLMCLKSGVLLARALQRVLVLPVFTDSNPVVDVSEYVSLECFRRNNQIVTFGEFQQQLCRGVGLDVPPIDAGAGATRGADAASGGSSRGTEKSTGSFCEDGALLQLENSYSLADYRGYTCWARSEDITNARDLGVEIKRCSHIAPLNGSLTDNVYSLDQVREAFGGRPEKVLLFLDLFGVNLLPAEDDLAATIAEPSQVCGWMPPERAAAAADVVMQALIPGGLAAAADASAASASGADVLAAGASASRKSLATAVLPAGAHVAQSYTDAPPPIRLRGTRQYVAVHLRRSDWFYYCAGARNCFYSITEAGAWLNASLAERGLDTLYVSTNADDREKQMLRRAVSGRVLYWEDVLVQLRRWQVDSNASDATGGVAADVVAAAQAPPPWLRLLPLNDELMVQMVEKAICMQASHFVSSRGSTFSNQIRYFRDGGLDERERDLLVHKFGPDARTAAARAVSGTVADTLPPSEPIYLCDDRSPRYPDERRFPDYHNPNIFLQQARGLWKKIKQALLPGSAPGAAEESSATAPQQRPLTFWGVVLAPVRALVRFVLLIEDGHAMAAANRFVEMYTGGAVAALVLEGVQAARADVLAECVADAAARAGAVTLHVAMSGVPEQQQVLLMQALEARGSLQQITRMGGAEQERGNTFTLLWRGDGLGRRAEPALLESLPTFLERTDPYVLAKSRVLLGDSTATLFRQVDSLRRLYGFDDPRDGECGPAALAERSRRA